MRIHPGAVALTVIISFALGLLWGWVADHTYNAVPHCQEDEALVHYPDYPHDPLRCVNIEELDR
jgi:hypothetical protein